MTFLGWLSEPFQRLSDLQLGDKKVTLNHLECIFYHSHGCFEKDDRKHVQFHARYLVKIHQPVTGSQDPEVCTRLRRGLQAGQVEGKWFQVEEWAKAVQG